MVAVGVVAVGGAEGPVVVSVGVEVSGVGVEVRVVGLVVGAGVAPHGLQHCTLIS